MKCSLVRFDRQNLFNHGLLGIHGIEEIDSYRPGFRCVSASVRRFVGASVGRCGGVSVGLSVRTGVGLICKKNL